MSSDVMRGTGPFSIDPCPKIGNCDGPLTTPSTPPPPYLETGPVCGHLPPGGPGRTDFRLRLPTGAHTALAGKTLALADLRKTLAGRRRTLTSCNHMRIGETEVLFRASSRP